MEYVSVISFSLSAFVNGLSLLELQKDLSSMGLVVQSSFNMEDKRNRVFIVLSDHMLENDDFNGQSWNFDMWLDSCVKIS